ncbi:phenylalanine--tRNA ligase subunit beta [Aphanothece hegewaldii CCALA 016]|uniref:Phenylalanine--tRNA ligase beta subunit n=1 Tax=Aphanothece hegewaldii CCALA 016 TaxID=2107694 RepID=A0A2T1LXW5_9CHRO|nr:phenylalanine--tRNA ligase subunit beta [Aphanothece hegewaldii]PSF37222.1 phenylalanine--tRNA ligase subunit beta [Aphanothece hegewaldii CCALA 016]
MRISVNWLKELVNLTLTPEKLALTLTVAGIEVEDIDDRRKNADGVVVGRILERQPHPNADKLSVCTVDIGQENSSTIVCGAPNARADIFVPVATLGTYLPAIDLKIKSAKLRGVQSEGMICSLTELGLEKESNGIYIFPDSTELQIGQDVRPLLGLDDVILDISPTANRADALSMIGVAREIAALTGATLSLPEVTPISIPDKKDLLKITVEDEQACLAYIGTAIEGVKIAPSPKWLQQRLQAAGVRPINNIVDVTNYVLLEWGQPLHAFDQDKLEKLAKGEALNIGVRFATEGETLHTLDGQTRNLKPQNLLITANDTPVAIAGVMGGEETEVDENTQNIILESALFDPITVRRSSKSQNLRSESSTRYEKGVNPNALEDAANRAIALIIELAGGTVVTQSIADARADYSSRSIELRLDRLHQILGNVETGKIAASDVERILTDLGCQLGNVHQTPKIWSVTVPSYRYRDLEREIDLIEEVARLYGYDHFCDTLPSKTEAGGLSFEEQIQRKLRELFRSVGLTELVQYSLVKPVKDEVTLANPLFAEYSALRTNLLSGLIDAFEYNLAQGNGALNGFEIGRVFWRTEDGIGEADRIGGILGGDLLPDGNWVRGGKNDPMTWYQAKGILESVFERLGLTVEYQATTEDERLHPGRTALLSLNKQNLGIFGQLHPQLRQEKGFPDAVYGFELNFDVLLSALNKDEQITPRFKAYSTYPAVARDLAFFAPLKISVAELEKTMKKAGGELLETVQVFDEYKGANVPEGERSLAFSLVYRTSDRTLTDTEVEPVHNKIREALVKQFQVTLRS